MDERTFIVMGSNNSHVYTLFLSQMKRQLGNDFKESKYIAEPPTDQQVAEGIQQLVMDEYLLDI